MRERLHEPRQLPQPQQGTAGAPVAPTPLSVAVRQVPDAAPVQLLEMWRPLAPRTFSMVDGVIALAATSLGWAWGTVLSAPCIAARHRVLDLLNLRFPKQQQASPMLGRYLPGLDELAQTLRGIADFFGRDRQQDQAVLLTHAPSVLCVRRIVPHKTWRDANRSVRIWRRAKFHRQSTRDAAPEVLVP